MTPELRRELVKMLPCGCTDVIDFISAMSVGVSCHEHNAHASVYRDPERVLELMALLYGK